MAKTRLPAPQFHDLCWIPILILTALLATPAYAYEDRDANRIDDRIDAVNANGWNFAFVDQSPAKRMRIGVENPVDVVFAIYVVYDHKPTSVDEALLTATGVAMAWPFMNVDVIESRATFAQLAAVLLLPGVKYVEAVPVDYALNHYGSRVVRSRDSRGLSASENGVLFPSVGSNLALDGEGIVVAVLDTGVNDDVDQANAGYPGHESLVGKFLGGGEFWCGQAACATPAAGSMNPQDHGSEASSYHGTHVAGTILGTGGPGGFFAGVAPAARMVDCKVLSDAGASVGGSNRGVDWVISNRTRLWDGLSAGSIWQGIDVVSMSLGSTECAGGSGTSTGTGSTLINTATDAGLVMVIATGNDAATGCISSPAAADKSIAVGASTHNRTLDRGDDRVTDFSNEGPRDSDGDADNLDEMKPSVVAPGAGIISAFGDPTSDGSGYQQLSGTSMATPHVSGCVALVLQANPGLAPLQVRSVLQNTAEHNVPTLKVAGDRGQDPFGVDPNYDPSCGWGLVDVYAACKEALNSSSGVQVVKLRAVANPASSRIDFTWITQREYPFQGFHVYRAPSVNNAPGAFTRLNATLIPGAGQPAIQGVSNRTPYVYVDADPLLALGQAYWYRVDWVDIGGSAHSEPPVEVAYGTLARVATAFYQVVHNAVDNDLTIRLGSDYGRTIGALGNADMEILGPGEKAQDSVRVILSGTVPPNTGTSTIGTLEHFWSVGFRQGDPAEGFLPPSYGTPWFLSIADGGYVNRTGRATAFSIFVNDSPGSPSGTTYVTDHAPLPAPFVEGGAVPTTLWIPEQRTTDVGAARLAATLSGDVVEIDFALTQAGAGASARILRSTSEEFSTSALISPESLPFGDAGLHFEDRETEPGLTYWYWVEVRTATGGTFMNGPVSVTTSSAFTVTFARTPQPNPMRAGGALRFTVGADAAVGGSADVVVTLHDLHGRSVRELVRERMAVGEHSVSLNPSDSSGRRLSAGMYYLSFRAGRISQTHKLIVVD